MRFRFLRPHAKGGLGEVSVAHDLELKREVALKEIRLSHADHIESRMRFVQEAEITGFLEHPGVVPVYGLGRYADGRPYYAMRFIRGKCLKEVIECFHSAGSPRGEMEFRQLLGRFVDVCNTIAYAHSRRILHRDIKPDNVMLGEFGETLVVDWGLAKQLDEAEIPLCPLNGSAISGQMRNSSSTLPGSLMGTPQYMSPEQASGHFDKLCPASDIYSLGSMLYCLMTGKAPYVGKFVVEILERVRLNDFPRPRSLDASIHRSLEAICLKAMMLRTEDRYESARALAEDVERWLADTPVTVRAEPWPERLARWSRRHRTWVQAGAAALIVVTAVAVASALFISAAKRREDDQRRVADTLREANERKQTAIRSEADDLILRGRQALDFGQAQEAKLLGSRAMAAIGSEPGLAELRAHAARLIDRSDLRLVAARQEQLAREKLARFRKLHDDALFHGTLLTGLDQAASLDATRSATREAMALYGLDPDPDPDPSAPAGLLKFGPHLTDDERSEVATACYELLLVHAEAEATEVPGGADARARNERGIRLLDRAEGLAGPSRALSMRRAQYRSRLGDRAGAAADHDQAEAIAATRPVDAFLLGEQSYRMGDYDRAIWSFEEALRLQPDHFWAQYFLAACHLKLDRSAMAKAGLTACLAHRPDFAWAYLLRGYAHGDLGEFDAAEADFRRVLDSKPDDLARYGAYVNRGGMRVRSGKTEGAVDDLEQAIRLRPGQFQAYANLGLAYQSIGRPGEALKQIDKAIGLAPAVAASHRKRARILRDLGDLIASVASFEEAAKLEPAGSPAAAGDDKERGRVLHQLGHRDEAITAYTRSRPVLAGDRELRLWLAEALLAANRGKEALDAMNEYLGPGDPNPDIYRRRGFERARAADHAGALADYSSAIELDPKSSATRARRGWGFLNESAKLALGDFDEAIKLDPGDGDLYNGRGYAQALMGRHREAVEDAERALKLGARSTELRARVGLLYNAACIYAHATGSAAHAPEARDDPGLADRDRDRAVDLLRQAIQAMPAASRARFVRQAIEDPAFVSIRDYPPFVKLADEFATSAPPNRP